MSKETEDVLYLGQIFELSEKDYECGMPSLPHLVRSYYPSEFDPSCVHMSIKPGEKIYVYQNSEDEGFTYDFSKEFREDYFIYPWVEGKNLHTLGYDDVLDLPVAEEEKKYIFDYYRDVLNVEPDYSCSSDEEEG